MFIARGLKCYVLDVPFAVMHIPSVALVLFGDIRRWCMNACYKCDDGYCWVPTGLFLSVYEIPNNASSVALPVEDVVRPVVKFSIQSPASLPVDRRALGASRVGSSKTPGLLSNITSKEKHHTPLHHWSGRSHSNSKHSQRSACTTLACGHRPLKTSVPRARTEGAPWKRSVASAITLR